MKDKLTIAICGLMDSGKSTLIKTVMKAQSGRTVEPDALCLEQETGKTITGTRIACPINDTLDIVLVDCPGHMEYLPEIVSGLCAADAYIIIIDQQRRRKSELYAEQLTKIADAVGCPHLCTVNSHSDFDEPWHYDINSGTFDAVLAQILEKIDQLKNTDLRPVTKTGKISGPPKRRHGVCLASVVWLNEDTGDHTYKLIFHGIDGHYIHPTPISREPARIVSKYLMLHTPANLNLPAGTRILICENTPGQAVAGLATILNP